MSNLMISGPIGKEPEKAGHDENRNDQPKGDAGCGGGRRWGQVPGVDACLRALGQLPGLVALGLLKPSQANAIRAVYHEILGYHQKAQTVGGQGGLPDANILELARRDPRIVSMLEPILTDEQVAAVMKDAKDGGDGEA